MVSIALCDVKTKNGQNLKSNSFWWEIIHERMNFLIPQKTFDKPSIFFSSFVSFVMVHFCFCRLLIEWVYHLRSNLSLYFEYFFYFLNMYAISEAIIFKSRHEYWVNKWKRKYIQLLWNGWNWLKYIRLTVWNMAHDYSNCTNCLLSVQYSKHFKITKCLKRSFSIYSVNIRKVFNLYSFSSCKINNGIHLRESSHASDAYILIRSIVLFSHIHTPYENVQNNQKIVRELCSIVLQPF